MYDELPHEILVSLRASKFALTWELAELLALCPSRWYSSSLSNYALGLNQEVSKTFPFELNTSRENKEKSLTLTKKILLKRISFNYKRIILVHTETENVCS